MMVPGVFRKVQNACASGREAARCVCDGEQEAEERLSQLRVPSKVGSGLAGPWVGSCQGAFPWSHLTDLRLVDPESTKSLISVGALRA